MRGNEAVSTAGNIAVPTMPIAGNVRPQRSERAFSRRVAMDIVGYLDVFGVLIGGLVPAAIYASYGELPIRWPLVTQTSLLASLFAYLCLRHFGLYDINRIGDLPLKPLRILASFGIAFAVVMGLAVPFGISEMHFWVWYGTWAIVSTTFVMATRICAHKVLTHLTSSGAFDARVAVYGNGTIAERLAGHLNNPMLAVRFVGAFDDRIDHGRNPSFASEPQLPVSGTLVDLIALGRTGEIDQIIIALPPSADRRTADVARRLEQLPVSLHVCTHLVSDLIDSTTAHNVSHLGPIGLLDIKTKPLSDWGRHVKALEDYVIAALALLVAAPVMLLVAIAIKLDSPGPIFFRQRRHGLNRRVIEVLKFRSMRVMEDGAEVTQATAGDPRVTRIGRFLRASSLDELPQLINVLRGEMSLIGPRPHALVHDDHYGEMLERYANRHQVKPGMTGWAQVNGFRGPTETPDKMRARVEADLYYIDNWSLWLDLRILVLTVFVGLHHKNAL
jgi:putative colanic acid biosynthesis UDP-glucose lipid carrier transferase